jgi:DNA-binding transcriptional MerR regulator
MNKEMSIEEIKALIEKDRQEREEKCTKEIEAILSKYNCVFDVEVVFSLHGTKFNIKVVAKE